MDIDAVGRGVKMGIRNKLGASLNPPSASGTIISNQTGNG